MIARHFTENEKDIKDGLRIIVVAAVLFGAWVSCILTILFWYAFD